MSRISGLCILTVYLVSFPHLYIAGRPLVKRPVRKLNEGLIEYIISPSPSPPPTAASPPPPASPLQQSPQPPPTTAPSGLSPSPPPASPTLAPPLPPPETAVLNLPSPPPSPPPATIRKSAAGETSAPPSPAPTPTGGVGDVITSAIKTFTGVFNSLASTIQGFSQSGMLNLIPTLPWFLDLLGSGIQWAAGTGEIVGGVFGGIINGLTNGGIFTFVGNIVTNFLNG